jgi:N-acetyl sugar amidotransferase
MDYREIKNDYRICSISIMDNQSDPDIFFDEKGICNYYYEYQKKAKQRLYNTEKDSNKLKDLVNKIQVAGKGKEYDCLIGISGGVDSTYVAYKVRELGLRPLAIHFDNGWNSELAIKNIEKTLRKLNIDLYTYVIDWEEFKSLQIAFLRASTPDGEIPTDHAIFALLFQIASQHGIKYIINGNNFATESVLPKTWSYGHIDWKYIRLINKKFGTRKLKQYPYLTIFKYFYYTLVKRMKIISILNYMDYDKSKAMELLKEKLDWTYYGGKHYESVYTRFYQGFILPEKFKIDKRRAHLSSLIFSNQITRDQALLEISKPIYPEGLLQEDYNFALKKLALSKDEFSNILSLPNKTYRDYPNSSKMLERLRKILNKLREWGLIYS